MYLFAVMLATSAWAVRSGDARAVDQYIRGTVADEQGDHYRAIFHYQEALRFDSLSASVYVALARDYLMLGNADLAIQNVRKALKLDEHHIAALELDALILRANNRQKDAIERWTRLSKLCPTESKYLKQLISAYLATGDFQAADKAYARVVVLEGESSALIKQVLAVYLVAGQADRAIPYLQKLIEQDSSDAALIYTLGTTYLQKGDTLNGRAYLEKANRMDPEDARFWTGCAILTFDRRDYAGVVQLADSAEAHVGKKGSLLGIKGTALHRLGRSQEAAEILEEAITLDTTLVNVLGTLALIYDGMDSLNRVVVLYEKAIRLSDSAAVYMNNLAYTLATRGVQLDRARELASEAIRREPKNSSYLDTIGWVEFASGNYDAARKWLKSALKLSPKSPDILEHFGDVARKLGSEKEAQSYYRRALANDPKNESVRKKIAP